jgi:hypothetical protein
MHLMHGLHMRSTRLIYASIYGFFNIFILFPKTIPDYSAVIVSDYTNLLSNSLNTLIKKYESVDRHSCCTLV